MPTLLFLAAACVGTAIAIQATVNGQLTAALHGDAIAAALVSFVIGTTALAVVAVVRGGLGGSLAGLAGVSWWRLTGGLLGAGFIFGTAALAPRVGIANLVALVICGQLLAALAIDHFGLLAAAMRPVSAIRLAGAAVMVGGVVLTVFGDRLLGARP